MSKMEDERWVAMQQLHQIVQKSLDSFEGDPPVESLLGALALYVAEIHVVGDLDMEIWIKMLRDFAETRRGQLAGVAH